jgi:beta-glucanase (GH16 family)
VKSPGAAAVSLALCLGALPACGGDGDEAPPRTWHLVWSDDFDGAPGTVPDARKWSMVTGGDGWGNQELQMYTDRPENAAVDGNGILVITARREPLHDNPSDNPSDNPYTSARLTTKGIFAQRYGRFEARLKLPVGKGLWPAFWLLGDNVDEVGWPACGEIDIMEERGAQPWQISGAIHGPGHSGGNAIVAGFESPGREPLSNDFHTFALEWDPTELRFYVDQTLYQTVRQSRMPPSARWVYDHPFFLLLNLSVGGTFGGPPDATTPFPQTLQVDWVRVFEP